MLELDKIEHNIFGLRDCTRQELRSTAEVLQTLGGANPICHLFGIKLRQSSEWSQLCVAFLLAQIWIRLGRYDRASESLGEYQKLRGDEHAYYDLANRYLSLRAEGQSAQDASQQLLRESEDGDTCRQVCQDLSDPTSVFDFVKLPNCPACSVCQLEPECITTRAIKLARTLYPVMDGNQIDQRTLAWVS
jgi:hypothetical protein